MSALIATQLGAEAYLYGFLGVLYVLAAHCLYPHVAGWLESLAQLGADGDLDVYDHEAELERDRDRVARRCDRAGELGHLIDGGPR